MTQNILEKFLKCQVLLKLKSLSPKDSFTKYVRIGSNSPNSV